MAEQLRNFEGQYKLMNNVDPNTYPQPEDTRDSMKIRDSYKYGNAIRQAYKHARNNVTENLMSDETALESYPDLWRRYMELENAYYADSCGTAQERNDKMRAFQHTLPGVRDYISRQSTLPEYMPDYHSEKWLDDEGNPIPGAVPPINAVRIMAGDVIDNLMARTGGGLQPLDNDSNREFEQISGSIKLPFPMNGGDESFFLTDTSAHNIANATVPSSGKEMVGVRGLHGGRDKVMIRPKMGQNENVTEGMVGNRISNERLVPFKYPDNEWVRRSQLTDFFKPHSPLDRKLSEDTLMPPDHTPTDVLRHEYLDKLPLSLTGEGYEDMVDKYGFPKIHGKELTDAQKEHIMLDPNLRLALMTLQRRMMTGDYRSALTPKSWGVDRYSPLKDITDEEKKKYVRFLQNRSGYQE